MKKVVCLSYDDAQEMILFGLSQFDAVKYLPTLGKILLNWNVTYDLGLFKNICIKLAPIVLAYFISKNIKS
jgi:hypothetical protein